MIPEYIHYVGNILIDTIRYNRHRLMQPLWFSTLGLRKGNYLLLTLNRHDLLEKKAVLCSLMQTLAAKAGDMPVVAPMHPYVERAIKSLGLDMPHLHILPPQSYLHFGFLINQAKGIVTDSGNIAEEATFLDVPASRSTPTPNTRKRGVSEPMSSSGRTPLPSPPLSTNCCMATGNTPPCPTAGTDVQPSASYRR